MEPLSYLAEIEVMILRYSRYNNSCLWTYLPFEAPLEIGKHPIGRLVLRSSAVNVAIDASPGLML